MKKILVKGKYVFVKKTSDEGGDVIYRFFKIIYNFRIHKTSEKN